MKTFKYYHYYYIFWYGRHTPSFLMEKKKGDRRGSYKNLAEERQKDLINTFKAKSEARDHVKRILNKVFPQETKSDSMTIKKGLKRFAFRPNNYRLKIPFINASDSTPCNKGALPLFPMQLSKKGIKTYKISNSLTVQVFPTCIIPIYSLKNNKGDRAWLEIKASNSLEFDSQVDRKELEIINYMFNTVNKLGYKGLDFEASYWVKQEFELKGDEFIDSLPENLIMHDTYFKKVYQKGIEFKSSSYAKNFISNRCLEDVAPLIAEQLKVINDKIVPKNAYNYIKDNYNGVEDVLPGGMLFQEWNTLDDYQKNNLVNEVW